ncbi:MAG: GerMN domain-containing protein [Geobacteraceae bacterium]|nr:GerMN domain-containing protein [Geobacteraceae bacterium]NTW79621.1 GerMN domain-containing protein [Geobacteraceae bacterium]
MATHQRKKIKISIVIPFLVFILFFSIMIWQKYRSSYELPVTPPQQQVEGCRTVTLFFAADGTRLAREARSIEPCDDSNSCLENILDELLSGPVGEFEEAVPAGASVDAVLIEGDQVTIEFNRTFFDAMPSGSSAEMLAVYSVVNTIAANFPQIKSVKLNVDGNKETVLRHLDLSDPLQPDYSLEESPQAEPVKSPVGSATKRKGAH